MTRTGPRRSIEGALQRARGSLADRVVRQFTAIGGYDRALALATQAFVALVPMLIVVAAWVSRAVGEEAANLLVTGLGLSGNAAATIQALVAHPPEPNKPVTLLGSAVLVFSVVGFARTLQRTFVAAWGLPAPGLAGWWNGLVGSAALVGEVALLVLIGPVIQRLPGAVLFSLVVHTVVAVLLWWPVQWLLLGGRVGWRALLPGAVVMGLGQALVVAVSSAYLPVAISRETAQFGLLGAAIVLVSWLVVLGLLLVLAAVLGAVAGRSNDVIEGL